MAPPPPRTASAATTEKPKPGVPYEVPALIIRDGGGPQSGPKPAASKPAMKRGLPRPAGLPGRKARSLQPPPRAPRTATPPPAPRGAPALVSAPAAHAPQAAAPESLDSLITSLVTDLVTHEPTEFPQPALPDSRRRYGLYFAIVAAVLSVIVALLPSESEPHATTPEREDATDVSVPAPQPAQAEPNEAPPPRPASEPAAAPNEPAKEPAPGMGGPADKRSDAELYAAAKAAYNSGRVAEAHKLAFLSWRRNNKSQTAELLTLTACELKDAAKAASSLEKVTRARRAAIMSECESMGVSL